MEKTISMIEAELDLLDVVIHEMVAEVDDSMACIDNSLKNIRADIAKLRSNDNP